MRTIADYLMRGRRGQVWVFVAILMVCLLGVLALAIDGGSAYLARRQAQNAADAGALAGARLLALGAAPAEVEAVATQYAVQRNGADLCQVTIAGDTVTVTATKHIAMYFAPIVGISEMAPSARAKARYGTPQQVDGLAPLAVKDFPYVFNETYTIWDDDSIEPDPVATHEIAGSYRGWLNLGCVYPASCSTSNDDLKNWMLNGYPGFIQAGSWVYGDPGTRSSTIQQARVGQILKVAVYDSVQELYSGKPYFHIKKFAVFEVTEVIPTGFPKGIRGKFIRSVDIGELGGTYDGGLRVVKLVQ